MTSEALTRMCLACIERTGAELNAFIRLLPERALEVAAQRDQELARGHDRGPWHGIPIAVKDNIDIAGSITTVGSLAFVNRVAERDATVVRRLEQAGAVIVGKTNMNELAAGLCGTNQAFGDVRNPWNTARSAGGSSSGAGAAVAAGLCFGALGTDTGGSLRIPAAWCGAVAVRPTHGLVSLSGVFPRAPSLDAVGPMGRCVEDVALLLDAICGFDPDDSNSALAQRRKSYAADLSAGATGARLGIVRDYTLRDVEAPVAEAMERAISAFNRLGAEIVEIDIPALQGDLDYSSLFRNVLLYEFEGIMNEAVRNLSEWEGSIGPLARNDLQASRHVERQDYERLMRERRALIASMKEAFMEVDALLTPAVPMTALPLDCAPQDFDRGRRFAIPFSYAALPGIVFPCGLSREGLPVGMQLVGNHFEEALLLRIAAAFEAAMPLEKHPAVFCGSPA